MTPDQEKALRAEKARALQGRDDSERLFKEERKLTDSLRTALAAAQGALVIPGLAMMYVRLALVRAFHHKDKAAFAAWTEVARGAENCPTCAAKWKQQAPSPTPAPGAGEQRKGEE
jgi:hypothetical protein